MFCTNCGAELNDEMAFCVQCGASIQRDGASAPQSEQAEPMPDNSQQVQPEQAVVQAAPVQETASQAQGDSKKRTIIIVVIAACVVIVAAIALFFGCSMQRKTNEAQQLAHQTFAVSLSIDAQGLDYATSTPVPMKISGTTFDGNAVNEEFLFDGTSASVPELERGHYAASIVASPISGNGTMYKLAIPSTTIVVTDYETEEQLRELGHDELVGSVQADDSSTENVVAEGSAMSLTPVAPIDVTDEMLNETCTTLENLGYSTSEVTAHRQLVETARDAARQEQLAKQITYSGDRFSLKVPASWGDQWSCNSAVTHSVNGGRYPNAWSYKFSSSQNPSQGFTVFVQEGGSYIHREEWTELPSFNEAVEYFIKNEGLSGSEFDGVIRSFSAKEYAYLASVL